MRKFFRPIQIGGASALIATTSLMSYAIGLIRDRVIAVNFGTTSATDTYAASFIIPDLLFNLFIAGALAAAFLPVFSNYLVKDKKEAFKVANTLLTGGTLLIAGLAIIAFIFMEQIVPFLFTKTDPAMHKDIVNMTRLMLPSAILFAISNTLGNILMSYKHFIAYAISPILYNLGIILGILFLSDKIGIYAAAIGVLIGASLHAIIRITDTMFTEYKFKPSLDVKHPGFKKIIKLMIPRSLSLIAWQINLYIFAVIGMRLMEGALAAFNFSRNIQSFAISLFGIAFATAVFPHLTEAISKNDQSKYTHHVQKTIQRILFFTIPAAIGIMIMSKEIVEIILGGGMFDQNSIKITSLLLFFFAISIPFESLTHIFTRSFYALQNTITPSTIILISNIIIACSTIFIAPKFGIKWFTLGYSIVLILEIIVLATLLRRKLSGFKIKEFVTSLSKTIIASGIMACVIILSTALENHMTEKILSIARICLGGGTFLATAYILKSEEIYSVKYIIDRLFKKKTYEKSK